MSPQYSRFFGGEEGSEPEYSQNQLAEVLEKIFNNGVFADIDNELEVTENDPASMSVIVESGEGWINGFWYQNTTDLVKTLGAADPDDDRIDRIVLRLDTVTNLKISVEVLEGTPAGSPSAPSLTQTSSTWEISLAQVLVGATVTSIADADITDERDYASVSTIIDEDDMTSDDDSKVPSQQSVKAYVDDRVETLYVNLNPYDAEIPLADGANKNQQDLVYFDPWVLSFNPDATEYAYWRFVLPPTYQGGNLQVSMHYKTSVNSGNIYTYTRIVGVAENEAYNAEPVTLVEGSDTVPGTAAYKGVWTKASSTPPDIEVGDEVIFKLARWGGGSIDTCTAAVDVTMVEIREV